MPEQSDASVDSESVAVEISQIQLDNTVAESVEDRFSDRPSISPAPMASVSSDSRERLSMSRQSASVGSLSAEVSNPVDDSAESNTRRDSIILVGDSSWSWLSRQPDSSYTLQLATASDDIYLAEFAQTLTPNIPGSSQFAVLPLSAADTGVSPPHTLILGVFNTFEEAENALTRLPDQAKKFGARVRNFGILKQARK